MFEPLPAICKILTIKILSLIVICCWLLLRNIVKMKTGINFRDFRSQLAETSRGCRNSHGRVIPAAQMTADWKMRSYKTISN